MSKQLSVAIAGLGNRGRDAYAECQFRFPDLMKVVAVADILPDRVREAAKTFEIAEDMCFGNADKMCAVPGLADLMVIATSDRTHTELAVSALNNGYHVLLEKPMAPTRKECEQIIDAAEKSGRYTAVCHVLRYSPFYNEIKKVLDMGEIGEIVTINAMENVGYWHQAHSFVRGNWRNSALSSPMILQKCCHDMDILLWLADRRPEAVSSFGNLYLFKPEKAPAGAAKRCLDGCLAKEDCQYDAEKIYITNPRTGAAHGRTGWPVSVLVSDPTAERVYEAIKTGPYGRCIYHCDNDVPDHMVVNMLLEGGITVNFTMTAFGYGSRFCALMGTKGNITADMTKNTITVTTFGKGQRVIDIAAVANDLAGHAGGDHRMVYEFLTLIQGGGTGRALTAIQNSYDSHLACFAAEYSRLNGGVLVNIDSLPAEV